MQFDGLRSCELGSSNREGLKLPIEAATNNTGKCALKLGLRKMSDALGDSVIVQTWRLQCKILGDLYESSDRVSFKMHLEAMIEWQLEQYLKVVDGRYAVCLTHYLSGG